MLVVLKYKDTDVSGKQKTEIVQMDGAPSHRDRVYIGGKKRARPRQIMRIDWYCSDSVLKDGQPPYCVVYLAP